MGIKIPTLPLTSGTEIPAIGYGVYMMTSAEVEKHLPEALELGYTHIDTSTKSPSGARSRTQAFRARTSS